MKEIFKDIEGYEGLYKIGNNGTLISYSNRSNHKKERVLKTHINNRGYLGTKLCKENKLKSVYIHILVAKHFVENKNDYKIVNHKDGNKLNNNYKNLEWSTLQENIKHAYKNNLMHNNKIVEQYTLNGTYLKTFNSINEASKYTGVSQGNISSCINGKRLTAGNFIWKLSRKINGDSNE